MYIQIMPKTGGTARLGSQIDSHQEKTEDEKWHPKVRVFLHRLSPLQQKIALLIANRYNKDEICEVLHISEKTYEHSFKMICSEKNKQLIRNL